MNTTHNTILITGGTSGIGFEMAKLFSAKGNQVIITGRDEARLQEAAEKLPGVTAIAGDVSNATDVQHLVTRLQKEFPSLNMVINNAGRALVYKLTDKGGDAFGKSQDEMLTNYFSIIRLNEQLIPLLSKQPAAAIVNVSSIVAFVPGAKTPTYSASKAALHSYTISLRMALAQTSSIKVFELMPPLVNTTFSRDIGGINGIQPSVVAEDLLNGLEKDEYEIHAGFTAQLYKLFLSSPTEALNVLNAGRE